MQDRQQWWVFVGNTPKPEPGPHPSPEAVMEAIEEFVGKYGSDSSGLMRTNQVELITTDDRETANILAGK